MSLLQLLATFAAAAPEPWPTVLPPAAVASHVTGSPSRILVAGAGRGV